MCGSENIKSDMKYSDFPKEIEPTDRNLGRLRKKSLGKRMHWKKSFNNYSPYGI